MDFGITSRNRETEHAALKAEVDIVRKNHPGIKIEELSFESDGVIAKWVELKSLPGNHDLIVTCIDATEIRNINEALKAGVTFLPTFFGIEYQDTIEVFLRRVNTPYSRHVNFTFCMAFYDNHLDICLEDNWRRPEDPRKGVRSNKLGPLIGARGNLSNYVIKISGYRHSTAEGKMNDLRAILNSVLFDLSCAYNVFMQPVLVTNVSTRRSRKAWKLPSIEKSPQFIFKRYIPELAEYYGIAETVEHLPFKFLCYFHILEYFSDKSAYYQAAKKLKAFVLQPDFHLNMDHYVNQAVNFFKAEASRNTTDKIKIRRVINQFIERQELEKELQAHIETYEKEVIFDCSKPLRLPAINFGNDGKFEESLTARIYELRCSIVHSNPDFDERTIPLTPTPQNLQKLYIETQLMQILAQTIVIKSSGALS
jgi:hypothetical protein